MNTAANSRRIRLTAAALLIALETTAAALARWPQDFSPPPWRGMPLTVHAEWEFMTPWNPSGADIDTEYVDCVGDGIHEINNVWTHAEIWGNPYYTYWNVDPNEGGDGRAETGEFFDGRIAFFLANWIDDYLYKPIWVQITYGGQGVPYVYEVSAPPWGEVYGTWVETIEYGPHQRIERWLLEPNPDREFVNIHIPKNTWIDEVIIDTISSNSSWPPGGLPNDNCINASPISEVDAWPFTTKVATLDNNTPCWLTGGPHISPNIWYVYTPTCTGMATVVMNESSPCNSSYLGALAIFEGSNCSPVGTMLCCNSYTPPTCTIPVVAGNEYLIEVFGLDPYTPYFGTGDLTITCEDVSHQVVCEPQGGGNPSHPPTYWYDVTTNTAIYDFHVQVFDPDENNYSNWVAPAGWSYALVERSANDWWACWYDPELDDPLLGTFRFSFDNDSASKWGHWRTTDDGDDDPYDGVVDRSENHSGEEDGYGYRVHAPAFAWDVPCEDCGPGPHWVDTCDGGFDKMPSGAIVGLDTDLDCVADTTIVMRGPVTVSRTDSMDDSASYPGTRPVDGHLDVIDTEIVEMSLTGGGIKLTAGSGLGQGGVLSATLGTIAEQPGDNTLADSFFDVFFEVDMGGGQYAYNHTAMRVEAVIECVPPRTRYLHVDDCIPLYDSPIPGQGNLVANLISADHSPFAVTDWYFDDTGVAGWGQTYTPPFWEPMNGGPFLEECRWHDLITTQSAFYAATDPISIDYSGYHFYSQIWLANNYAGYSEEVVVELRKGAWYNEGELLATAKAYVTNQMSGTPLQGLPYLFDFGTIDKLDLNGEALVVKIMNNNDSGGQVHIWWDSEYCLSGLHAIRPGFPGLDTVVCEPQGGVDPNHPSTYWYDVTPVEFGRCDFHVRVYDPDPNNYTNPTLPNPSWQFAVHQVGSEWWASWWDPNCQNAIFNKFRFQFQNDNRSVWGDWRTTIGASSNPAIWAVDFAGHHFTEADGYGHRVHAPCDANVEFAHWPQTMTGVFNSDSQWADFDGDGDLDVVICGEDVAGVQITETYENQGGLLVLHQSLTGAANTSSDAMAWGDYDNDGDLDLAVAGMGPGSIRSTYIYENDGSGTLTVDAGQVLTAVNAASLAWADYDLDGDLDLYVQGSDGTNRTAYLYRNDPLGTLTVDPNPVLVGLASGSADWADWDGDGDPDLMVTGRDPNQARTIFYENDPVGTLTDGGSHGLPGLYLSDAAWGDYDGDGDLDLVVTGNEDIVYDHVARVYNNDGTGVLTDVTGDLMSLYRSSCAWGDYDNDGDLDLVFCGYTSFAIQTRVLENTGAGFTVTGHSIINLYEGSLNWADVDRDGDLDLFITGYYNWQTPYTRLYENRGACPNAPPLAPADLEASQHDGLRLPWTAALDPETASGALYYCVAVGTTPGGNDVFSGTFGTPLMGNCGQDNWLRLDLPTGRYYWRVRAIDSGFEKSAWSCEQVSYVGDIDCDGDVDFGDINPFVEILVSPATWEVHYPCCSKYNADMNLDGSVDFGDINPFVDCLVSGNCP